LELLEENDLTGLFFITGNMAEKLSEHPETVALLDEHQIGYHSSSHSTHPTIFEFTDIERFQEAYQTSLMRETSYINPLTGEIQGSGGIHALRSLFPKKNISAFRAPGYSWSPPHLEALKTLGITYDFSTKLSTDPITFNEITFYPFPIFCSNWQGGVREHILFQKLILKNPISILTIHPSTLVNKLDWDLIYYSKNNRLINPKKMMTPTSKSPEEISNSFYRFELLIKHLKGLQKIHLLKVTPKLESAEKALEPESIDITKCYNDSIVWAGGFGYKPKFLYNHFRRFFYNPSK